MYNVVSLHTASPICIYRCFYKLKLKKIHFLWFFLGWGGGGRRHVVCISIMLNKYGTDNDQVRQVKLAESYPYHIFPDFAISPQSYLFFVFLLSWINLSFKIHADICHIFIIRLAFLDGDIFANFLLFAYNEII